MRALLLAAALSLPAAASEELVLPALEPKGTLASCLGHSTDVRNRVHAFNAAEREEFNRLYAAYVEMVVKRRNEGWSNGNLGNQKSNWRNAWDRYGLGALLPWNNAPQWDSSRTRLDEHIARTEQALKTAEEGPRRERLVRQLAEYKEFARGRFGVCNDWANETQETLRRVAAQLFVVRGTALDGATAGTSHAYTLVCAKSDLSRCLSFDPWKRGWPELFTDNEAARGPGAANGCFTNDPPPGV